LAGISGAPRAALWAITVLSAAAPGTPAQAQDSITVTARKQDEALQAVPVTVTAVGAAEIRRFQYDKPEDVMNQVPTLRVQVGGPGSGGTVSLRGVGSSNLSAAFDSAVALDFDGVVVSSMRVLQFGFDDIRQIEVLKGPQSLYFGKSASAGVLSFKSADPTREWEAGGRAAYEFEEHGYTLAAYVSGPVTETLGLRLSAQFNDVARLYRNSAPGVADPVRGEQNLNLRATLQLDPSDRFSANLKVNHIRYENDGALRFVVTDCGANGVADPYVALMGAFRMQPGYSCDTSGKQYFLPDSAPPLAVKAPLGLDNKGGRSFGKSQIWFGRLKMDWELDDALTLSSVTGYFDMKAREQEQYSFGGLFRGTGWGLAGGLPEHDLEQFSQELRLTSSWDGMVNFMLGAFYETRDIVFASAQQIVAISLLAPDPVTGSTFDWYKRNVTDTDAFSVFGSVDVAFTDTLAFTAGLRWTTETKDTVFQVPYMHAILAAMPAFVESGFDSGPVRFKDSNFSPEASLTWHASKDLTVYGAFKTGFKSGGIDNTALPSATLLGFLSPSPSVRAATTDQFTFDSETALGGEIGVKARLLHETLTLNSSLYYYVFEDLQTQHFDGIRAQYVTNNASELTTKGVDVDFRWQTPVDGFSLFGSLAYTDAKFTRPYFTDPVSHPERNIDGRRAARAPLWSGNLGADLRVPLGDALELGLTGNLAFTDDYFTNDVSLGDYIQPGYVTVDVNVSVGDPDGRWQLAFIGRNLSDKRAVTTSGPRTYLPPGGDDRIFDLTRGRQLSVEASVKF
jgi:iron complex outermembrane receptor protein